MENTSTREWISTELQTDPALEGMSRSERLGALLCRHENAAHEAEKAGDNYAYFRESSGTRLLQLLIIEDAMAGMGYQRRKNGPGDWIRKK